MPPTQTEANDLATAVTANATARTDKARANALRQAKNDAKSLWDALRPAAEKDMDGSVRADLIAAAKTRVALVAEALKGL